MPDYRKIYGIEKWDLASFQNAKQASQWLDWMRIPPYLLFVGFTLGYIFPNTLTLISMVLMKHVWYLLDQFWKANGNFPPNLNSDRGLLTY